MALTRRNEGMLPSVWNDFFDNEWFGLPNILQTGTRVPAVNIKDTTDKYEVEMAAPGMKKEDFKVDLENNLLTISAEEKSESSDKDADGNYSRREFNYHSFKRAFTLPDSVESEKIAASYKDGVLDIVIPKKEEAKPKPVKHIDIR